MVKIYNTTSEVIDSPIGYTWAPSTCIDVPVTTLEALRQDRRIAGLLRRGHLALGPQEDCSILPSVAVADADDTPADDTPLADRIASATRAQLTRICEENGIEITGKSNMTVDEYRLEVAETLLPADPEI